MSGAEQTKAAFEGDGLAWNRLITGLPGAHILQTWQWGEFKRSYGWQPLRLVWRRADGTPAAAAQVLLRPLRPGKVGSLVKVAYTPRGPLLDWEDAALRTRVLADLETQARAQGAIFLKMDPELILGKGVPGEADDNQAAGAQQLLSGLRQRGWRFSGEQIQFRNTIWVDLDGSEDDWLARMRQKTRYNIRLAVRRGVSVRLGTQEDLGLLYRMYAETSLRDGFVIRPEDYYRQVWGEFHQAGMADLLIAEVDRQPVAGLILFFFGGRAWYLYGMSRDAHREKMPNYLLQWEAMRQARARGCRIYDLWGAPEVFSPQDAMWGVYRFKEGLGGQVVRTSGAWDFPARKIIYPLYTRLLPAILSLMRRRGIERTRREVTL